MEFNDFLAKQEGIYEKFRASGVKEKGLSPNVPEKQGGYLVIFRHPDNITSRLENFSERVNEVIPIIKYGRENAHTTISDYMVGDDFSPDETVLNGLSRAVHLQLDTTRGVEIDYRNWMLNQNTGIVAGYPNANFTNGAERIVEYAKLRGLELHMPWGAHITACRFLEEGNQEQVDEVLRLFKEEKPLGASYPTSIDVGHFSFSREGLEITTHERFPL